MTLEEIRNGIAENPELETELLADIKGKGYIVRSAEENTAWEKQYETDKINPRIKEIYMGLEKDVEDHLGIKKENVSEKVYDMVKRAGATLKGRLAEAEQKLADALAGKGDDVTKAQLTALKAQVEQLTSEKDALATEFTTKELNLKAGGTLDNAFSELQVVVPANVSDKDKAEYIKDRIALLASAFRGQYQPKEQDGQIVWSNKDGEIQMTGANFATAKDLLAQSYKYDFEVSKKGGSGSGGSQQQQITRVQTKDELYGQVAKEGIPMGSEKWTARVNELAKSNGIALPS